MQTHHWLLIGAAAVTFFYLNSGTSAGAQTIPGVSSLYNVGYNFQSGSGFSTASPVAGS